MGKKKPLVLLSFPLSHVLFFPTSQGTESLFFSWDDDVSLSICAKKEQQLVRPSAAAGMCWWQEIQTFSTGIVPVGIGDMENSARNVCE